MKSVRIVTRDDKPEATNATASLTTALAARGVSISEAPELLIAVGGDGTVLSAAADAIELDIPVCGINVDTPINSVSTPDGSSVTKRGNTRAHISSGRAIDKDRTTRISEIVDLEGHGPGIASIASNRRKDWLVLLNRALEA